MSEVLTLAEIQARYESELKTGLIIASPARRVAILRTRGRMDGQDLERLTKRIVQFEQPEKIILFGSQAQGTATEDSDFDLLVISRSTLPRYQREVRLTRRLFGSGLAFDLLVLTPDELEQRVRANGPFLREILSSGKVLYERSAA